MQKVTTYAGLQDAIQLLKEEQTVKSQLLKEQLIVSYESLKPLNLFKSALKDISSSPGIGENLLGSAVGLASGYLSKKIFIGTSGNLLRKLIGSVLQYGVTNVVAKHPDAIKTFGQFIMEHLGRNKETKTTRRDR
jgi:hypothetical protein